MKRVLLTVVFISCVAAVPAAPQPKRFVDLEITHAHDCDDVQVCVPLSLAKADASKPSLIVEYAVGDANRLAVAQLTAPGLLTEQIKATAPDLVRRDVHFSLSGPFKTGGVTKAKLMLTSTVDTVGGIFAWKENPGEFAELVLDQRPVLRYVLKAYDNSTTQNRDKTYKVFHHLYNPAGTRFVTNGGDTNDPPSKNPKDNLYPHHRGLFFAYNIITYGGNKPCDTWHAKPGDTHQSHAGILASEAGGVLGRHRVAVDWHGPKNEIFAKEEREMTVYRVNKGTLVEFAARLKTTVGKIKLEGDPQHSGFQFRAHNDVHEQKDAKGKSMELQTYYLRPDGKGAMDDTRNWDPKTKKGPINLPWDVGSFIIDGKRYSVAYLNHPSNPGESRWSERNYARFGCYFEYELTEERPLVLNYRVWLQDGEMTGEQAVALSRDFVEPPKVVVK